jgi:hypothetical protein
VVEGTKMLQMEKGAGMVNLQVAWNAQHPVDSDVLVGQVAVDMFDHILVEQVAVDMLDHILVGQVAVDMLDRIPAGQVMVDILDRILAG